MRRSLEAFAKKNKLSLFFIKRVSFETRLRPPIYPNRGTRVDKIRNVKWECDIYPPILMRTIRVIDGDAETTFLSVKGTTRKEVREKLLEGIRGKTLAYDNSFDRECGDTFRIKVPKRLC